MVEVNDVIKYCEANNLILIDDMCIENLFDYGIQLFIIGIWIGAAGIVFIISVLIAHDLSDGRESINI